MASAATDDDADPVVVDEDSAYLVGISPDSPEWNEVRSLVGERSRPHMEHYKFSMEIEKLWRVCPGQLQKEHRQKSEALGAPMLLFHGTSSDSVKGILQTGFLLPKRSGMFGRGIYFAECPLKSVQFAKAASVKKSWWDYCICFLTGFVLGGSVGSASGGGCGCCCSLLGGCIGLGLAHNTSKSNQKMLVCEVFLGKSRMLRGAKHVKPTEDLKRGLVPRLFGAKDYNSVYAPGGLFGAVNVAEYIVYQPHQAIPKYVMEFKHTPM